MKTITSNYTTALGDEELHIDASVGDVTIRVPLGMEFMITKIHKVDPSPNAVIIETDLGSLTMRAPTNLGRWRPSPSPGHVRHE